MKRLGLLCCVLGAVVCPRAAHAQVGAFFATEPAPPMRYELQLSAAYQWATREQFLTPVFLLPQALRRIEAQQLKSELDFRLSITPRLAVQAVVPLAFREVELQLAQLVVSQSQALPGVRRSLDSWGLLDPTLGLSYRFYSSDLFDVFADAGTRVPLDDNPESLTFPARVPLSTGQTELFVGAGLNFRAGVLQASADYRFGYLPGSTAAYLIRRFDDQSYTNGALTQHLRHRVRAQLSLALSEPWSVALRPEFSALRMPELVEEDGARAFHPETWLDELSARLSLRYRFDRRHSFELFYDHLFLEAYRDDPFFPIAMPERGFGVLWRAWSR